MLILMIIGVFSITKSMLDLTIPLYARSLDISVETIGSIGSSFGLGLLIFEPLWGFISEKVTEKKLLLLALSLFSTYSLAYIWAKDFRSLIVLQFIGGMLLSCFGVASRILLTRYSSYQNRGEVAGLWWTMMLLGQILGPVIAGFLSEKRAYEDIFTLVSLMSLLGFLLSLKLEKGSLIKRERESERRAWRLLIRLSFITVLYFFTLGFFRYIFPIYLKEGWMKFSEGIIGIVYAICALIQGLSQIFFGKLSDKVGRRTFIFTGASLASISFLGMVLNYNDILLIPIISLYAIGSGIIVPCLLAIASDLTSRRGGRIMGVYGAMEDLGLFLGPFLTARIYSAFNAHYALILCSLVLLVDGLLAIKILDKEV